MFDLDKKVTAEMLREREIAIHKSPQYVIDTIMKMKNAIGYDDFCFLGWFELGGFTGRETEDQMQLFATRVRQQGGTARARHRLRVLTATGGRGATAARKFGQLRPQRAHGGRSGPPCRNSIAGIRSSVVVAAQMSAAGSNAADGMATGSMVLETQQPVELLAGRLVLPT
jgi:hypothetical protein